MPSMIKHTPTTLHQQVSRILSSKRSTDEERLAGLTVASGILGKSWKKEDGGESNDEKLKDLLLNCLGINSATHRSFCRRLLSTSSGSVLLTVLSYAIDSEDESLRILAKNLAPSVTKQLAFSPSSAALIAHVLVNIARSNTEGLMTVVTSSILTSVFEAASAVAVGQSGNSGEASKHRVIENPCLQLVNDLITELHASFNATIESIDQSDKEARPCNDSKVLTLEQLSNLKEPIHLMLVSLAKGFAGWKKVPASTQSGPSSILRFEYLAVLSASSAIRVLSFEYQFCVDTITALNSSKDFADFEQLSLNVAPTEHWEIFIFEGLRTLLQNKLGSKDLRSALILASDMLDLQGPSWLLSSSNLTETEEGQSTIPAIDNETRTKFVAILFHLACTDIRVLLDSIEPTLDPETQIDPDVSHHAVSLLRFLANGIQCLVGDGEEGRINMESSLTVSVHHALAEAFVAVLAHLVDWFEIYQASSLNQTRHEGNAISFHDGEPHSCNFIECHPLVRESLSAVAVWLTEDSEACGIQEVREGAMEMLIHVVKERNAFGDLAPVFMNFTAREGEEGEEDLVLERFFELGGVACVVRVLLHSALEELDANALAERKAAMGVAVCCLLNLVGTGGCNVLGQCASEFGEVKDLAVRILKVLTDGAREEAFTSENAIHAMNACCLSLYIIKDMSHDLPRTALEASISSVLKTLHSALDLHSSDLSTWEEISELWYLCLNAFSVLARKDRHMAVFTANVEDFGLLVQQCSKFKASESYEDRPALAFFKSVIDSVQ
ncbi:hypothetical protein HDU77_010195 [Chytriomyces hyalinus]|nr:hypothetical protein HDU77_010195 [Chytriomyces hyalinus]